MADMQIKLLFRLILAVVPLSALGQSSYLRTGSEEYRLIERLEIKTRSPLLNQSFNRPLLRRTVFESVDSILNDSIQAKKLSRVDRLFANEFLNDPEWNKSFGSAYTSFGLDVLRSKRQHGYLVINPVVRTAIWREKNNDNKPFIATLGLDVRGAHKKIGYSLYATFNSERLPNYMSSWMNRYKTVPGGGNFKSRSDGKVAYADIRGSIQTSVTKYIDLQLGYDRHFLGNGYRSLFLSDFSNSTAFFKVNTRIWKLNFQSLYMQLKPQDGIVSKAHDKKYLRINTLGIDATKWLNISFFDAVVLGRTTGFDLNYVLPITFLRAMEQQSGSPDNALFGMNAKANLSGKIQLYGQILLDEFKLSEIKARSGWWANKFGYQIGAKYIDVFGIKNLDLQLETNRVRPFTYTHFDSVSNYTHYNQPLAHPLGANFHEWISIIRFQPTKNVNVEFKTVYYRQGLDSLGRNTGNNILIGYNSRPRSYGWEVGSGDEATCLYTSFLLTTRITGNILLDASLINRNFKTTLTGELNTFLVSVGLRWNIARREFDF
jgi:hypothetical protein